MARPNQQGQIQPQEDFPWYMKYGARVLGIVGAGCKLDQYDVDKMWVVFATTN